MRLEGRTALVTGAGRGIGAATARLLASDGARVVVNDLDAGEAEQVVAEIAQAGGSAVAVPCDLTAPEAPDLLVQGALDSFGGIDIIVNNAGYIWNGAMHNHSDEQWHAMLDMHVGAPFRLLRAFQPWLKAQTAKEVNPPCRKVVNISSVSGLFGAATQVAYSAGKAAVVGLTRTLAKEWGRFNVTVNCVAFGHIQTRLTQPYDGDPPTIHVGERDYRVGLTDAQIEGSRNATPLGRSGRPEDGAGAVYMFCIPESDFVSGEVLVCGGGARG